MRGRNCVLINWMTGFNLVLIFFLLSQCPSLAEDLEEYSPPDYEQFTVKIPRPVVYKQAQTLDSNEPDRYSHGEFSVSEVLIGEQAAVDVYAKAIEDSLRSEWGAKCPDFAVDSSDKQGKGWNGKKLIVKCGGQVYLSALILKSNVPGAPMMYTLMATQKATPEQSKEFFDSFSVNEANLKKLVGDTKSSDFARYIGRNLVIPCLLAVLGLVFFLKKKFAPKKAKD